MQTTTSRDNFGKELHFQNVLNFGNIACSILVDTESILSVFSFAKKKLLRATDVRFQDVLNRLQLFNIKSQ